mgnify:CR=1 FL=1
MMSKRATGIGYGKKYDLTKQGNVGGPSPTAYTKLSLFEIN